jgi:hypothetical protein
MIHEQLFRMSERAMQLVVAPDQRYDVELLTDAPPSWTGLKVMCMDPDIHLPVGSTVEIHHNGSISTYTVSQALSPAAPRGWRFFLLPTSSAASPPPSDSNSEDSTNAEKYYIIEVSGLIGKGVRRSTQTYKIPYSSLSAELQRITKAGGKIVSISPAPRLG